jgi:hypothetical protein
VSSYFVEASLPIPLDGTPLPPLNGNDGRQIDAEVSQTSSWDWGPPTASEQTPRERASPTLDSLPLEQFLRSADHIRSDQSSDPAVDRKGSNHIRPGPMRPDQVAARDLGSTSEPAVGGAEGLLTCLLPRGREHLG